MGGNRSGCALALAILCGALEARAEPPKVITGAAARKGTDAPRGYHHEDRRPWGPLIGGIITTAMGGVMIAFGGYEHGASHGTDDQDYSGLFYIEGGVSCAVGVPLVLWGIFGHRHVLVRNTAQLDVVPVVGAHAAAASLRVTF